MRITRKFCSSAGERLVKRRTSKAGHDLAICGWYGENAKTKRKKKTTKKSKSKTKKRKSKK